MHTKAPCEHGSRHTQVWKPSSQRDPRAHPQTRQAAQAHGQSTDLQTEKVGFTPHSTKAD